MAVKSCKAFAFPSIFFQSFVDSGYYSILNAIDRNRKWRLIAKFFGTIAIKSVHNILPSLIQAMVWIEFFNLERLEMVFRVNKNTAVFVVCSMCYLVSNHSYPG